MALKSKVCHSTFALKMNESEGRTERQLWRQVISDVVFYRLCGRKRGTDSVSVVCVAAQV